MCNWQRASVLLLSAVLVAALMSVGSASAQKRKARPAAQNKAVTKDTGGMVVATVNGEKITRAEVYAEMFNDQIARLQATNPGFIDRQRALAGSVGVLVLQRMATNGGKPVTISREEIMEWLFKDKPTRLAQTVDDLIRERAVRQEAKRLGISLKPEEIDAHFKQSIQQARTQLRIEKSTSDAELMKSLGVRPDFLRRAVVTSLLAERLVLKDIEAKAGHPIGVDDYVEASHILVSVRADPTNNEQAEKAYAEAKAKIQGFAADIKSGKTTFEKVASEQNPDNTKLSGGKLGIFVRGMMVPEFEKVAFSLQKGQISEPVRTQFGWHLVRLDRPGKETTAPERDQTLKAFVRSRIQSYVAELVKRARVTNTVPMPEPFAPPGR